MAHSTTSDKSELVDEVNMHCELLMNHGALYTIYLSRLLFRTRQYVLTLDVNTLTLASYI